MKALRSTFNILPGETAPVIILGFLLLSNFLAVEIAGVVAVSGFLSQVGVEQFLIVWVVDMLLLILMAGLQSLIIDRFSRVTLLRFMVAILALFYIGLRLMFVLGLPQWINYTLLYLLSDQQLLFFPVIFWLLANDTFSMVQAKRLFPVISAAGFIGQIIGLLLAGSTAAMLSQRGIASAELLSLNAIIYILALILILQIKTGDKPVAKKADGIRETLSEGWGFVKEVPSFRYLMLAMVAVGLVLTVVDYHFLAVSSRAFVEPAQFQRFYSFYRLGITIAAIVLQAFVTGRLIKNMNLQNVLMILPVALLGSMMAMLSIPGLITAAGGRALARLPFSTVDDSARKSFQALVPEERRGRVAMFMDSYLYALGTIIACIFIGLIYGIAYLLKITDVSLMYLGLGTLFAIIAIAATIQMRKVYDASLFNWRLKRRSRGKSVLEKLEF